MDHRYLLTYNYYKDGIGRYLWFENEDELNVFIEENEGLININEKIYILGARNIE